MYPGSIPLDTDLLGSQKNAMLGLGYLAQDILGTATLASGLACTPTAPASMQVSIAPGRVYSSQNVDNTAYGSIAADTTHQVLKQGVLKDAALLSCPAPSTTGFSIAYLIEAAYSDSDALPVILNYYNAANPSQPFSGAGGLGAAQPTVRQGVITLTAKPGIAAATGTQVPPAADAGNVGLWVVTVANGQTTIVSGNVVEAASAPFIPATLAQILSYAALMAANNTWSGQNTFNRVGVFQGLQVAGNGAIGSAIGITTFIGTIDASITRAYAGFNIGWNGTNWFTGADGLANGGFLLCSDFHLGSLSGTPIPNTGIANQVIPNGSLPATGFNISGAGNFEIFAPTSGLALKVDGTTQVQSGLGVFGATPPSQPTGYGTPTGGSHQASFAAGSITLANLAAAVAQLVNDLKSYGLLAA